MMAMNSTSTLLMTPQRFSVLTTLCIALSACMSAPPLPPPAPVQTAPARPMPADTLLGLLQAEQLIDAHQPQAALPIYEREAMRTRDPHILERATRLAIVCRQDASAQKLAQTWLQSVPGNLQAESSLAGALWRQGQFEAAGNYLLHILQAAPDTGFEDLTLYPEQPQAQEQARLLATLDRLIQALPDNPQPRYARAFWLAHHGDIKRAHQDCERTIGDHPDFLPAYLLDARLLEGENRLTEALDTLQQAVKEHPDAYLARQTIAALQLRLGHPLEAELSYLQLAQDVPADGDFWLAHALLALQNQHEASARSSLQRLISLGEHLNDANYYLGQIDSKNHPQRALQHFDAVEPGADYVPAQQAAANLRVRLGRQEEALQHLRDAAIAHPEFASDAAVMMSDIFSLQARYREAAATLDARLAHDPHNADLLYNRAMIAVELNDMALFEQDIRAVLVQNPENPVALNAFGYTLAEKSIRLDEARTYIEHALRISPNDPAIIDSLGWVKYRQGHIEQALSDIQKAWDMSHDDEIGAHLGELLWHQGHRNAARKIWQQSLQQAPDSHFVLDVEKRLGAE